MGEMLKWLTKERDLSKIRNGCEKVADRVVNELGKGTQYLQLTPMIGGQLGFVKGKASFWHWHVAAYKDGMVYDKLTGAKGMALEQYKKLFDYNDVINFDLTSIRTLK